jgi:hypothetical protein
VERRKFLLSVCGVGAAAAALKSASGALPAAEISRSRVVNRMNQSIFLKIVGPFPEEASYPDRGGFLFPEEEYFAALGTGKRVVIAWDYKGETVLTLKEINVSGPSQIEIQEGKVLVTADM